MTRNERLIWTEQLLYALTLLKTTEIERLHILPILPFSPNGCTCLNCWMKTFVENKEKTKCQH